MAYVLSLRPHSPLKRSFSDNPYLSSCSPPKDVNIGALRDITPRNASTCSLYSLNSSSAGDWLRGTENTPPLASCSLLDLVTEREFHNSHTIVLENAQRKRSCGLNRPVPNFSRVAVPSHPYSKRTRVRKQEVDPIQNDLRSPEPTVLDNSTDHDSEVFALYEAIHVPLPEGRWSDNTAIEPPDESNLAETVPSPQPFRRWMSTLRRRHIHRHKNFIIPEPIGTTEIAEDANMMIPRLIPISETMRRMSESMSSSLGCITAVRSASVTVASASIAPQSDVGGFPDKVRLGKRSSYYSEARMSTESHGGALGPIIDEGAWLRSLQRRKIVEELISSEESYISDLKVLVNVGVALLLGVRFVSAF